MNPVRTKWFSIIFMIVGAVMVLAGIALFYYGHDLIGIIVLIVGVTVAMICRAILSLFSKLAFERMRTHKD